MIANIDLLLVVIYFIIVLIIGILASKKETKEGFLIADRKVNAVNLNATISASLAGGGILAAYIALVYLKGLAAIWIFIGASLGILIFIPFAKKIKRAGDKEGHYTMLDFLFSKFGKQNNLIAASLLFLMFLALILVELIIGGKILSIITGLPYWLSVIIGASVVLIYLLLGGFKSVVKTDVFQYLLLFLFVILSWFLLTGTKIETSQLNLFSISAVEIIGYVIMGIFIIFVSADVWQRAYSARNIRTVKRGFIFAAISYLIIGLLTTALGLVAKINFPNINPNNAMVYSFSQLLPAGFLGIGLVALFSAVMSSADTGIFVTSLFFSRDLVSKYKKLSKEELISLTKKSIFVLTLIAALIAIFIQNLVFVVYTMYNFALILAPAVIGSFYFNLRKKAIMLSLILGILSAIIIVSTGQLTAEMTVIPFLISAISLPIGQKIFKI
ncbi:MAG: hypothetical protein KAU20_06535 [Nanoarchaeota archaeon]|nr:hypothetical protein [Nanoarchaeota archaeon]